MDQNPYTAPDQVSTARMSRAMSWSLRGLSVLAIFGLLSLLLISAPRNVRETARRHVCLNNLKQIGLALAAYHDKYESFPPAYTTDENGHKLHSWRTLLLPYLDQKALYESIDLNKRWDDPANVEHSKLRLACYACPSSGEQGNLTQYVAIVDSDSVFPPGDSVALKDIKDSGDSTLCIVEASTSMSVPWMSPQDISEHYFHTINEKTKLPHPGIFNALFVDGRVQTISIHVSKKTLHGLMTRAGGEVLRNY